MTTPAPAQARIETWRGGVKQLSDISQDVIDEMEIVHSLLPMGISSINTLKLLNPDGQFSNSILAGDYIMVYLWREGQAENLRFVGKLMAPTFEGDFTNNEFYLNLIAENFKEQELLAPPELPIKKFVGATGKTILDYLVGLCDTIQLDGTDNGSGMVSTHDIELNETSVYDALVDILEKAQTSAGAIGFDSYTDPQGLLHVFSRGTKTSGISLTDRIYNYEKREDIHPIRNRITAYGKEELALPENKDAWTEQEGTETPQDKGWSTILSNTTLEWGTPATGKIFWGSECFRAVRTGNNSGLQFKQDFPNITSVDCRPWVRNAYKSLRFSIWLALSIPYYKNFEKINTIRVKMFAPDSNNAIISYLYDKTGEKLINEMSRWFDFVLAFEEPSKLPNTTWRYVLGTPDLSDVRALEWYFDMDEMNCIKVAHIDNLHFALRNYSYTANDAPSQALYGIRSAKPIVEPNLTSNAECEKRAKAELEALKNKIVMLESLTCEGDNFIQGYKQAVSIPQDNISGNWLIGEVRDLVKYTTWDSRLTFIKQL